MVEVVQVILMMLDKDTEAVEQMVVEALSLLLKYYKVTLVVFCQMAILLG
mgnify:CR=1 FL=1